jgi:hypothetical protein
MANNPNDILGSLQQQMESTLLAKEQVYNRVRATGEQAPAKILSMMDTGIRIGDNASMLHFNLEVFPNGRPSFRAETQNAIADTSRPKYIPGATVYVKFDPNDPTQVALDHAPTDAPKAKAVKCPSCGASQKITDEQTICAYCGSPLNT